MRYELFGRVRPTFFEIALYPLYWNLQILFKLPYFPANYSDTIAMHVLKFSFFKADISYNEFIHDNMQSLTLQNHLILMFFLF